MVTGDASMHLYDSFGLIFRNNTYFYIMRKHIRFLQKVIQG